MGSPGRKVAIGGIALTLSLASGAVFAGSLVNGVGRGVARATKSRHVLLLDATGATTDQLYPGATGDAVVRVKNPNPFPVEVTHIEAHGVITSDDPDCSDLNGDPARATGVTLSAQSLSSDNEVPARSEADITVRGAVGMNDESANACQGVIFEIPVTLTARSS